MPIKKKKKVSKPHHAKLEVFDIPVEDLVPDEDNPNEMDEATFDALVEEIQEQGFDEPIQVRPHPAMEGKWQIGSGHHRTKAAIVVGMEAVPAIIKHWTDREQKVALVKRNSLRGDLNKQKLTTLYRDLAKGKDGAAVQRELGFVHPKRFEAMIETAASSLPPKQRKKLEDAKETIKSVDDLSSVLNRIFKEAGSELDEGYMVFSFGGKNHHYFQIDDATENLLQSIVAECEAKGVPYRDAIKQILENGFDPARLAQVEKVAKKTVKPAKKKRPVKKAK